MSPRSIEEIVADYYASLEAAFLTGKLNHAKLHFADDIVIMEPKERIEGKAQAIKMLEEKVVPFFSTISMQRQFADKGALCSIFDLHAKHQPKHNHPIVSVTHWHKVRNGMIYEMQAIYDTAQWKEAVKASERFKKSA